MKGIILAGGTGTRLRPLTRIINKHLLPVGPYPMIYWPIKKLKEAGIHDILIITNKHDLGSFITLLGLGEELGVHLTYKIQNEAGGITEALGIAETFIFDESHHNNTANSCRGATEDSISRVMKGDENERLQQPAKNTSPYAKNRWNHFKSANEEKLSS